MGLHGVTSFADGRVVLVENLAVSKDQADVLDELVPELVPVRVELLLDGGDVHGFLDHFLVRWELLHVHRIQERPGVVESLHFGHNRVADCQIFVQLSHLALLGRGRSGFAVRVGIILALALGSPGSRTRRSRFLHIGINDHFVILFLLFFWTWRCRLFLFRFWSGILDLRTILVRLSGGLV